MPTDQDFQDFFNESKKYLLGPLEWGVASHARRLKEKWGTGENIQAYLAWSRESERKQLRELRETVEPTGLVRMIDDLSYNIDDERNRLVASMYHDYIPWIPLGKDDSGVLHRIVPNPHALRPEQLNPITDRDLLPQSVLGVNLNVQPAKPVHRRAANMSEENTVSNESDDSNQGGFVFHQIGNVEFGPEDEQQSVEELADEDWTYDGFCAVMKFDRSGRADGVYILYDLYIPDQVTGTRNFKAEGIDANPNWGAFGDSLKHVACARVADKLSDLQMFKPIVLKEIVDHPVEIVRVVKTAHNTMIRVTVAEQSAGTRG